MLIATLLILVVAEPVDAQVSVDRQALEALYHSTGGDNWTNNDNWLTGADLGMWSGITTELFGDDVAPDERVVKIDLHLNNLDGPLPADWNVLISRGALSQLDTLILSNNRISGSIPDSIGHLGTISRATGQQHNLTFLDISQNGFTGSIPASFVNLRGLTELRLARNEISGLPDLSAINLLERLYVMHNRLTFEDLVPNLSIGTFEYAPQKPFGQPSTITVLETRSLTLEYSLASADDYQWFKDGEVIPGATSILHFIENVGPEDTGVYVLTARSNRIQDLTLESEPTEVTVTNLEIDVSTPGEITAQVGEQIAVEAVLPPLFQPQQSEVCYRLTGEKQVDFECAAMTGFGDRLTASLPSNIVTIRGIDYYFRFTNNGVVVTEPRSDAASDPFRERVSFDSLLTPIQFSSREYMMFSVPVELDNRSPDAVIGDLVRPVSTRVLRWNAANDEYEQGEGLSVGFSPGAAFWHISSDPTRLRVGRGLSVDASLPYEIELLPGWTQIGNPFAFPVAWTDVHNAESVDAPVRFDPKADRGDEYIYDQAVLQPWEGYWVFNSSDSPVMLSVDPQEAVLVGDGQAPSPGPEIGWRLQLIAAIPTQKMQDSWNYVGIADQPVDEHYNLNVSEAPPVRPGVRISIVENENRLARSIVPETNDGAVWPLQISLEGETETSSSSTQVRLELIESGSLPDGFDIRLFDVDKNDQIPLNTMFADIRIENDRPKRDLLLIVGTADFMDRAMDQTIHPSTTSRLHDNYPDPFYESTRIIYEVSTRCNVRLAVYDALGRHVRTLVNKEQDVGSYTVDWTAEHDNGVRVSSGVYFYRFEAANVSRTKTMVVLR